MATTNILSRLVKVQSELNAPKNQTNSYGGYNYRSCEDILEAVKPLLVKYELGLILSDEIVSVGDRIYVKATASLFDANDATIPALSNCAYAREEETKKGMDASQITGSSSSYARKYALNGLFCIDDNKDADRTNNGASTENANDEPAEMATQEQIAEILKLNCNLVNIRKRFHIERLEELTSEQADFIITNKKEAVNKGE